MVPKQKNPKMIPKNPNLLEPGLKICSTLVDMLKKNYNKDLENWL